jgi:hypothetical protein
MFNIREFFAPVKAIATSEVSLFFFSCCWNLGGEEAQGANGQLFARTEEIHSWYVYSNNLCFVESHF